MQTRTGITAGLVSRVAEEAGGVLGRHRIHVEATAAVRTAQRGEPGRDLEVPVIIRALALRERRAVEQELEGRIAERALELAEHAAQRAREVAQLRGTRVLEGRRVPSRQDPGLEREARGERREAQDVLGLDDHPRPL